MQRFWEVDFARGLAVVLMVTFNWLFALGYMNIFIAEGGWLFWWLFPRAIASAFIFIAGLSFSLSYSRIKNSRANIWKKYGLRGGKIFLLGILATLATWLLFPEETIVFGILHLLGIAIILAPIFRNMGRWNLMIGLLCIFAGMLLQNIRLKTYLLFWLGLPPAGFQTFDYFPLLPWFGVFLIGIFAGNILYRNGKRQFKPLNQSKIFQPLNFLGRHSLVIYIVHQPILIGILYLLGYHLI
jgi:uncharacterized membrane protein